MIDLKLENIKNALLILISIGLFLIATKCFFYFFIPSSTAVTYYTQGVNFLNQKDYQNAYYNFSKIRPNSPYYPIALYRQGYCAEQLKDTKSSIEKYSIFIKNYKNTIFTEKATYELAKAYFSDKEYKKSEYLFNQIRLNYTQSDYAVAANYFLAEMIKESAKKDKKELVYQTEQDPFAAELTMADNYNQNLIVEATNLWLAYLDNCPQCTYSQDCINEIITFNKQLSPIINVKLANAYYANGNYEKAAAYFERGNYRQYWDAKYFTEKKLLHAEKAKAVFNYYYPKFSRTIDKNKLNTVLTDVVNSSNLSKKEAWIELWQICRKNQAQSEDFILYNLGLLSTNERERASYFTSLTQQYQRSDYAPEALWELFRFYYKNKSFKTALSLGEKHISLYPQANSAPAILFWVAKIYHEQRQFEKAKFYYQKLMKEYPDDYYAFRAAAMYNLKNINPNFNHDKISKKLTEKLQVYQFPFEYTNWDEKSTKMVTLAINANDLTILDDIGIQNKLVQSWIMDKNGKYSTSSVYARDWLKDTFPKPDFNKMPYKLAYPLHYTDILNETCTKLNLNVYLMLSLLKEESHFNSSVVSTSNARGLMQLMPDTALFIAQKTNIPYLSPEELFDPQLNILLGCSYFAFIKNELRNSDQLAVAAYNGGPNAVNYWFNNKDYTDFDEFVEDIPYNETKNYVKKVYKAYWNYVNIYQ